MINAETVVAVSSSKNRNCINSYFKFPGININVLCAEKKNVIQTSLLAGRKRKRFKYY